MLSSAYSDSHGCGRYRSQSGEPRLPRVRLSQQSTIYFLVHYSQYQKKNETKFLMLFLNVTCVTQMWHSRTTRKQVCILIVWYRTRPIMIWFEIFQISSKRDIRSGLSYEQIAFWEILNFDVVKCSLKATKTPQKD